jgi:tetratricopeptide (TPR) repeat protein
MLKKRARRRTLLAAFLLQFAALAAAQDNAWIGRKFMPKSECKEMIGSREVPHGIVDVPYIVTKANGEWLWVGRAWVKKSHVVPLEGAVDYYTERLRIRPDSWEAYTWRGVVWHAQGEFENALKDFTQAIRLDPKIAGLHVNRGATWEWKGELDNALKDYTEAIRLDPKCTTAYLSRARIWSETSKSTKAIQDYAEVIALDPENATAYVGRGNARVVNGNFPGAIDDFCEAIRIDPNNARAYHSRGMWQYWTQNYDAAIEDLTAAIRIRPLAQTHMLRGMARHFQGEIKSALEDYSDVIRSDPLWTEAYINIAWLRSTLPGEDLRDGESAVGCATKACELTSWKDAKCLSTLAAAYAEIGQFEDAVKAQRKAQDLAPEDDQADHQSRIDLYRSRKPYREQPNGPIRLRRRPKKVASGGAGGWWSASDEG